MPASSGKVATPPETVTRGESFFRLLNCSSMRARMRSATSVAPVRAVSGSTTANSSPP